MHTGICGAFVIEPPVASPSSSQCWSYQRAAISPTLSPLRGVTSRPLGIAWDTAQCGVGRPDLRFRDLRHSGLTWSAATGTSVAELMRRAGHTSPAAALRYQHATEDRDRALADALGELAPKAKVVPVLRGQQV
jgi:hypothetical protein